MNLHHAPSKSGTPSTKRILPAHEDFPILARELYGRRLVYLDSAASAQKPLHVLESMRRFYSEDYSNVHRGVHTLSQRATDCYEAARETISRALNLDPEIAEVIFVRGTTEAANLVAHCYCTTFLNAGDEILLTEMEHHSNIVPWQIAAQARGGSVRALPITGSGEIDLKTFEKSLDGRVKLAAFTHVSNVLGTVNPVAEMTRLAHSRGIPVFIDGAQAVPRMKIDLKKLDADFYAFSGHKVYGPTGIGILYGKKKWLSQFPPYQGGGSMIREVTWQKSSYQDGPARFEAGTPDIAGAVGLAAAFDYLGQFDMARVENYEGQLLMEGESILRQLSGVRIHGEPEARSGALSFQVEGIHPHDVGTVLDREGIAVRVGHHCAQPLMKVLGVPATVRASVGIYSRSEEWEQLAAGIRTAQKLFGVR